ncbi:cytochrome P450 [Streptomyces piniterrae]|uniref:cytochrome P450 n=1 Tax=Streptomyces piniterrae TaxID=2571125 RepID=UPI001FE8263C|nr:cytochrome P450 [Streptomyces piniterrae]
MLCLASAHRDPQRYPEPDRFNIHRTDKAHLTLGFGVHYCPPLAAELPQSRAQGTADHSWLAPSSAHLVRPSPATTT